MNELDRETCDECGFDAARWRVRDAVTFFDALGWWWRHATADLDANALNRRPVDGVWSGLEYGVHSALVTAVTREGIAATFENDGVVFPNVVAPEADQVAAELDRDGVVGDIEREAVSLARLADAAAADRWSNAAVVGGTRIRADTALFHAAHDASHHQFDVARGLRAIGAGTPVHAGRVVRFMIDTRRLHPSNRTVTNVAHIDLRPRWLGTKLPPTSPLGRHS